MKQYFGYVRVSTQKQGEGVSLEAQKDAITHFARNNNLAISKWFEEKVTAAKKGRPIFNAMIRQLMQEKANGLIVHKIDRSARNFADWARIGDLADAGIDVHFATESLDFRSRGGRLSADIQAVIAADYIRNLREECIKGMRGRLKQGLYPWGAPIGYLDNGGGKKKTPDPKRATLIKQAFELYASGNYSINSLQREMKQRGLLSTRGRTVSKRGIETILANPFYYGIIKVRTTGETFEGVHQPLISQSLFQAVQDVKTDKAGKKVTRHNHTYRGLLRCAHCELAMIPERQKGRIYYRCHTQNCQTTSVREDMIEAQVIRLLRRLEFSDSQCQEIDRSVTDWLDNTHQSIDPASIQLEAGKLEHRLCTLTDAMIDGVIERPLYVAKKEALLIEKRRLVASLGQQDDRTAILSKLEKILELLKSLEKTYISAEPDERRQIVKLTTSNRLVTGRSLALEPRNWIGAAHQVAVAPIGEHHRPTSRTFEQKLKDLVAEFEKTVMKEEIEDEEVRKWFGEPANDDETREAA